MIDVLRCVADGSQNRPFYSRLTPWARIHCASREEHVSERLVQRKLVFYLPDTKPERTEHVLYFHKTTGHERRKLATSLGLNVKRFHSSEIRLLGAFHQTIPSNPFRDATVFH
jgi:hypothetical protein